MAQETASIKFKLEWMVLIIIISMIALVRIRLLDIPLERDEGEYAYVGQLLLQGIPPYLQAYNMKWPGIYGAYAVIMALAGQTTVGIHLGLLVVNISAITLIFLIGRALFCNSVGLIAAASYALLSTSQTVLGFQAHATHFVVLSALGGLLLLIQSINSGSLISFFGSGLLLGLTVLMKQHGVFFSIFAILYLLWHYWQQPDVRCHAPLQLAVLGLGILFPVGVTFLILITTGAFDKFWFWTVTYAREYVDAVPFNKGIDIFIHNWLSVMGSNKVMWGVAGLGLAALLVDKRYRRQRVFLSGFLIGAFLSVCPGFYFRNHYFITLLPAVALLVGLAADTGARLLSTIKWRGYGLNQQIWLLLLFLPVMAYPIYQQRHTFFTGSPLAISRASYYPNPFIEAIIIAKYIKEHSLANDRVAVIGSEPEIFFYAGRKSATGYIYTYGLMERHPYAEVMQKEMIKEIETACPLYLILVNVPTSWLGRPDSCTTIFSWFKDYSQGNYDLVGIVDIISPQYTKYAWDAEVKNYSPLSRFNLMIYRSKKYCLPQS